MKLAGQQRQGRELFIPVDVGQAQASGEVMETVSRPVASRLWGGCFFHAGELYTGCASPHGRQGFALVLRRGSTFPFLGSFPDSPLGTTTMA